MCVSILFSISVVTGNYLHNLHTGVNVYTLEKKMFVVL